MLLGLDGFPHRAISPGLTPRMWALAEAGGRAAEGGMTDLPSSTDPGFCSLLTGCYPTTHGVRTTSWRYARLPDWAGVETPRVPTIFDVGHLNESDTVGHDHGPESSAAQECYAATDRTVGELFDAMQDHWAETIVVIVSDHDMQARDASPPIDLMANGDGLWDLVIPDGGAALVHLRPGVDAREAGAALGRIDGIETWLVGDSAMLIAGARRGRIFKAPQYSSGGFHGAPATARTVALVGGGHPDVQRLAAALTRRRPHLADWAPTLAPILGADMAGTDGANLLA